MPSTHCSSQSPTVLPFDCTEANNAKMKAWLLQEFTSSTFNTCSHCSLPYMAVPPAEIHLKDHATPKVVHTLALTPVHWQERVHQDLMRDEALGVIELVPHGEAMNGVTEW